MQRTVEEESAQPTIDEGKPAWLDPCVRPAESIPPTDWILQGLLLKRAITLLSGKGGSGKSLMLWMLCIVMVTGEAWGPFPAPARRRRVLILSAEDDFEEIERRMEVAFKLMGLNRLDYAGWIKVYSLPRIKLVERGKDETQAKVTALHAAVKRAIQKGDVGLLAIDPYIKASGGLDETDNNDMEEFQGLVRETAEDMDCAILMADHQKKGSGDQRDATRGASSKVDDARIACTLSMSSKEDHTKLGLPGVWYRCVKFQIIKSNYGEMMDDVWFLLTPMPVGNGEVRPALRHVEINAHEGDWEHHEAFLKLVEAGRQDEGKEGWPWNATTSSRKAGRLDVAVAESFGISGEAAKQWIAKYEQDGLIVKEDWTSPQRNKGTVWRLGRCADSSGT